MLKNMLGYLRKNRPVRASLRSKPHDLRHIRNCMIANAVGLDRAKSFMQHYKDLPPALESMLHTYTATKEKNIQNLTTELWDNIKGE